MLVNSLHHNFKHKNMTPPPKNNNKPIVGTQPPIQPTPCPNDLEGCTNLGKITLYDWWPWGLTNCIGGPSCFDNTLAKHPNAKKYAITFEFTSNTQNIGGNKCTPKQMCSRYNYYDGDITNGTPDKYFDNQEIFNFAGWLPGGKQIKGTYEDIQNYKNETWVKGCCKATIVNIEPITEGGVEVNCEEKPWYDLITTIETNPTTGGYDGRIIATYNNNTINVNDFALWYWKLPNGDRVDDYNIGNLNEGEYVFYIEDHDGCSNEYTVELFEKTTTTDTTDTTTPTLTTITLNETPLIIDDCQDLLVSAKLYFSQPSTECVTNSITASLLPDNPNFSVEQLGVFDSDTDGFGNWVDMGIRILSPNSGDTFNINLNFIGLNDCCEYDIRVDNISVDCYSDEQRIFYDSKKCPGFELRRVIDNKKSWVYNPGTSVIGKSEEDNIVRNRGDRTLLEDFGFVNRKFAPSSDADLPWRYTDYYVQSNILEPHSNAVLNNKELVLTFNMCADCCYEYSPCPKGFTLSGGTDICYSGTT